jgi:predicted DNA-binding transcriptional regulator YafY
MKAPTNKPTNQTRRSDGDRRLKQAMRFARALKVLQLIQGRGRYNVNTLAAELECSTRTIHRDLQVLEFAGVPWFYDDDQKSYRVRPDFRFPTLNLTDDELIGQATAAAITGAAGLNINLGAKPATRKIAAASSETVERTLSEAEKLTSVLDLKLADHSRHHEMVRTVQRALIQSKELAGTYASPYESKLKRLTLHPYRLCLVKQAWYLIGRPSGSDRPQTYRVTRFRSLRMLESPAQVPADFDLKAYFGNAWGVYRGDRSYDVEVHFSAPAAGLVTETTWHHTQKLQHHGDGGVTLSFCVDGLDEIAHWILGWSGRAKVLQPPELRHLVLQRLRAAIALNEDSNLP